MTPIRPRYARIKRLVKELLDNANAVEPPIDVESIARSRGVSIQFEQFDRDVSGVLVRDASGSVIGVQKIQSDTRKRFTIAHELGHLMLHDGELIHVDRSFRANFRKEAAKEPRDVEEIEANAFAANLLMPKEMIERVLGSRALDLEDATEIDRLDNMA
jgi:Zn-dependent peptidase ImmA (M78 family)